ncbi:MAG: TRAP transporter small permease subunit [Burkholderiaceae bacterium]
MSAQSWGQLLLYPLLIAVAWVQVRRSASLSLRADADRITRFNSWFIRWAFWAVLLVGLVDAAISFMRVEGLLGPFLSADTITALGRPQFRGPNVHIPLIGVAFLLAFVSRGPSFVWLALLVVLAELGIVLSRFIFSYEQAFMGDLVRFWYAAFFLFASAYTLVEEGHVRVDVFYAGFKSKTKGFVNAVGSLLLGMAFCWVILVVGFGTKTSIINAPILNYEVSQSGFGMYVKYIMAGFLGIFAISMLIQFVSYLLEAVADFRDEPGKREPAPLTQ